MTLTALLYGDSGDFTLFAPDYIHLPSTFRTGKEGQGVGESIRVVGELNLHLPPVVAIAAFDQAFALVGDQLRAFQRRPLHEDVVSKLDLPGIKKGQLPDQEINLDHIGGAVF